MCNSNQVLEYLAVTAMIDHENDDREKKKLIGYRSTLSGTLSSDCLACNSMRSEYRREKREKLGFEVT